MLPSTAAVSRLVFFLLNLHLTLVVSAFVSSLLGLRSLYRLFKLGAPLMIILLVASASLATLAGSISSILHYFLIDTTGMPGCMAQRVVLWVGQAVGYSCAQGVLLAYVVTSMERMERVNIRGLKYIVGAGAACIVVKVAVDVYVAVASSLFTQASTVDALTGRTLGICVSLFSPTLFYATIAAEWITFMVITVAVALTVGDHWMQLLDQDRNNPPPLHRTRHAPKRHGHALRSLPWYERWVPRAVMVVLRHDTASLHFLGAGMAGLVLLPISLASLGDPNGIARAPYDAAWVLAVRWAMEGMRRHATLLYQRRDPPPPTSDPPHKSAVVY